MHAHRARAPPRVVAAQPRTMITSRLGSLASSRRSRSTSLTRGPTVAVSHLRSLGTTTNAATTSQDRTADERTRSSPTERNATRSADAPAKALNRISSAMWVTTCTDCCSATAVAARSAPSPPFCRNRALNASPPTPAGVVVAAKVLATCISVRLRKLTSPSAHAHSAAAAPTYFSADTARPEQPPPPVRRPQFGQERRHGADERQRDVDQRDEQHHLDDLVAVEPGDGLGLDLVRAGLQLHLVARRGDHSRGSRESSPGYVWAQRLS